MQSSAPISSPSMRSMAETRAASMITGMRERERISRTSVKPSVPGSISHAWTTSQASRKPQQQRMFSTVDSEGSGGVSGAQISASA